MKAVKNQKKSFLLLFFGLFFVGLVLSLTLYKVSNNYFLTQYKKHYTEILDYLGRSVVQQEKASEQLMYSAAEYIKKVDSSEAPLSTVQLKSLNARLGITHSFIIDKTGKFIRSTNEDPSLIPNLYSFCEDYKTLLNRVSATEVTPIIPPVPEIHPYKFLTVPNGDRFVHVGLRVDFLKESLKNILDTNNHINKIDLYSPDGTNLGSFNRNTFKYERSVDLSVKNEIDGMSVSKNYNIFSRWVDSPHTNCCQCNKLGNTRNGQYQYLIKAEVSNAPLLLNILNLKRILFATLVLWTFIAYFFSRHLSKVKEIITIGKQASQVAHDIRSPLFALKSAIKNDDKELGDLAIKQIVSIADDVLIDNQNRNKTVTNLDLVIKKAIKLKLIEFPKQIISYKNDFSVFTDINETVLLRVLSNLFNNSIEASLGKQIDINMNTDSEYILISIQDNGFGFTVEQLNELQLLGTVQNPNGNGLGLSAAIENIHNLGGSIKFSNRKDQAGAVVTLRIPKLKQKQMILLDDNVLIGRIWSDEAKKAGIELSYYKSVEDLDCEINKFELDVNIYLDSDLKGSIAGEEYAKTLYDKGYKNINIVTSNANFDAKFYPWIKDIKGKSFPG